MTLNFSVNDIKKLKIISPGETIESVKQYTISQVQKTDFIKAAKGMKYIFLKPMQMKSDINWKEVMTTTQEDLKSFFEVLGKAPFNKKLLAMSMIIILFGFWDTFVVTFLVDFLNKIIADNGDNLLVKTKLFT